MDIEAMDSSYGGQYDMAKRTTTKRVNWASGPLRISWFQPLQKVELDIIFETIHKGGLA